MHFFANCQYKIPLKKTPKTTPKAGAGGETKSQIFSSATVAATTAAAIAHQRRLMSHNKRSLLWLGSERYGNLNVFMGNMAR